MRGLLVAAALCVASVGASAQTASISVGWQNLTFSLTDLDTADGVTPWLNATASQWCISGFGCGGSASELADYRPAQSHIDTAGVAALGGPDFEVYGFSEYTDFLFSPRTRLTIAGLLIADSSGHQQSSFDDSYAGLRYTFTADASGSINAFIGENPNPNDIVGTSSSGGRYEQSFSFAIESGDDAAATSLRFNWTTQTSWTRTVSVIPEPSTYALMLAGLLGVMWRRHVKSPPSRSPHEPSFR